MAACAMELHGYAVRAGTAEDVPQILALLNETFRTPINEQTWLWYTRANPVGPSRVYVALEPDRERIAGVIAFAPISIRLNAVSTPGVYAHHLAYKPVHRNTMSYLALCGYALNAEAAHGVRLVIGPPNKRAYPVHKVLGKWFDFGRLDLLRLRPPFARSHTCEPLRRFTGEFDDLYARIASRLAFCVEKDAEWANWRFLNRPGSPYTVYCAREDGKLAGYIVLKRWQEPNGYRKAHLLDLHALTGAALERLLDAAEYYANDCDELNLWAIQGYPYRARLEARGFSADAAPQPLLARTCDGTVIPYPAGEASLCYGDGDTQY